MVVHNRADGTVSPLDLLGLDLEGLADLRVSDDGAEINVNAGNLADDLLSTGGGEGDAYLLDILQTEMDDARVGLDIEGDKGVDGALDVGTGTAAYLL